jgi:DNA-binding CsgD family transcriptional regulator
MIKHSRNTATVASKRTTAKINRQADVERLMGEGMSADEIYRNLGWRQHVSFRTVQEDVREIKARKESELRWRSWGR